MTVTILLSVSECGNPAWLIHKLRIGGITSLSFHGWLLLLSNGFPSFLRLHNASLHWVPLSGAIPSDETSGPSPLLAVTERAAMGDL